MIQQLKNSILLSSFVFLYISLDGESLAMPAEGGKEQHGTGYRPEHGGDFRPGVHSHDIQVRAPEQMSNYHDFLVGNKRFDDEKYFDFLTGEKKAHPSETSYWDFVEGNNWRKRARAAWNSRWVVKQLQVDKLQKYNVLKCHKTPQK